MPVHIKHISCYMHGALTTMGAGQQAAAWLGTSPAHLRIFLAHSLLLQTALPGLPGYFAGRHEVLTLSQAPPAPETASAFPRESDLDFATEACMRLSQSLSQQLKS